MEEKKRTFDERFTDFADSVSEGVSKWWFTTASFVLLVLWIAYGLFLLKGDWFTSTTWNFPLNTITTVGEWFLEGFILISTARVEKRNARLQQHHETLLEKLELEEERDNRLLEGIDTILEHQFVLKQVTQKLEEKVDGKERQSRPRKAGGENA